MPELPEVEVAKRIIEGALLGRRVMGVAVHDAMVAGGIEAVVGGRVAKVERRGKWLRLVVTDLGGGEVRIFAHLGMSGRWVEVEPGSSPVRHERARLEATLDGAATALAYADTRRLGRIRVSAADTPTWLALGPDALDDGVDARALHAKLGATRRTIKEALLDQRVLAGVGNIHAIEALWRARIDPRSRADALSLADVRAVARGVRASLAFGLRRYARQGGADYVNEASGENPYRIYERKGEPCPRCGTLITKIVLGGRGTTLCPHCQRRISLRRGVVSRGARKK